MSISAAGLACLRFSGVRGFGLKSFHQAYSFLGSVKRIAEAGERDLLVAGLSPKLAKLMSNSNQESNIFAPSDDLLAWLQGKNRYLISIEDPHYPDDLRQTHLAPALLYIEGELSVLGEKQIAVVGSRKPSMSANAIAQEFAYGVAVHGWSVCSGFALGIDASAHMGALAAQGATVAVMATGIDRCYPSSHQSLRDKTLDGRGVIVSEMPLGTPPLRHNFPRRNRIVSGLSKGVVVIEAGLKSGSLITARFALEQNRDVFAVPGPAQSPNVMGCHSLIQQGAKLVTCVADVLEEYGLEFNKESALTELVEDSLNVDKSEHELLGLLGGDVQSFDALLCALDIPHDRLSDCLLSLEMKGYLSRVAGGYQRCKKVRL